MKPSTNGLGSRPVNALRDIPIPLLATRHSCPDAGPHLDAVYTIISGRITCAHCLTTMPHKPLSAQLNGHRLNDHTNKQLIIWNTKHSIKNHDGVQIFKDCVVTLVMEELELEQLPNGGFGIRFHSRTNPADGTPQYLVRFAHINRPGCPVGIDFWDTSPVNEPAVLNASLFNVGLAKDEDTLIMMQHVREIRPWDSRGRAAEDAYNAMIERVKAGELSYQAGARQIAEQLKIEEKSVKDIWRRRGFSWKDAREYEKRLNKI